jgi:uncharacterized protein YeaO (DUF488 family)
MSLRTKSILAQIEKEDGYRISVMNRHTLEDSITPDKRINEKMYDKHEKLLAPSSKLLGDYYKRGISWKEYEGKFKKEICDTDIVKILKDISLKALKENITLLCIEEKPDFCHRRLLAEECKKYQPNLEIIIK